MPREVCPRTLELMIINRGFGEIKPCVNVNSLTCPCCHQTIEKIESIKSFILLKSTGKVLFKFKKSQREKGFKIESNKIGFFEFHHLMRDVVIKISAIED